MTILNVIVADQLKKFKYDVDKLIKKGEKKDVALLMVLKACILRESNNIRCEGNGYSEEWEQEAERRGLQNIKTTPKALDALLTDKTDLLFEDTGVFTKRRKPLRGTRYFWKVFTRNSR